MVGTTMVGPTTVGTTTVGDEGQVPPPLLTGSDGGTCSVAEVCALHEHPVPAPVTQQDLIQMLVGDWALCGATSVFGTQEAGFSFLADGTWYKLYASGGQFIRGQGFGEQGTWDLFGGDASEPQVNLNIAGGGGIDVFPAFATSPRKMRLNNNGVWVADYVFASCPADTTAVADASDDASTCSFCGNELVCFRQLYLSCPVLGAHCSCGDGAAVVGGGLCVAAEAGVEAGIPGGGGVWACN
jgi:hypothetical protein